MAGVAALAILKNLDIDFGFEIETGVVMKRNLPQFQTKVANLKEAYENYLIGKTDAAPLDQKLQSYLGMLSHANQYTLSVGLKNAYSVRTKKQTKDST